MFASRSVSVSHFIILLNEYAFRLGTSCPAHYHVLHDEIGFSSDEIQQLTYWVLSLYENFIELIIQFL